VNASRPLAVLAALTAGLAVGACSSSSTNHTAAPTGAQSQPGSGHAGSASIPPKAGSGSGNKDCPPPVIGIDFCETFAITGAVSITGTAAATPEFSDTATSNVNCADWVGHQPDSSDYPQLRAPIDPVGGHTLQTQWKLPYQAGTYQVSHNHDVDGLALNGALSIDNTQYSVTAAASSDSISTASATIVVKSNGAGSISFDKLINVETKGTISGKITWTCVDAQ
jgi:hypothetical protein